MKEWLVKRRLYNTDEGRIVADYDDRIIAEGYKRGMNVAFKTDVYYVEQNRNYK